MTVLLTGGTGYIGSHAAAVLLASGHQVVLLDNLSNSDRDVLERLEKLSGTQVPFVEADVRDADRVEQTLASYGCDSVMHFAGLKAVGDSVRQPLDYYANNVQGTLTLLQAMARTSARTIVFSSSATVYGEPQYLPYDEAHPTAPMNAYGRTKLQIEEMLRDLCLSDPAWRVACLRYFNPVGAHASGLIGEAPQGIPNNLMPIVAKVASGELALLKVFGVDYDTPDGTGVRDYIHVMDLAEGHLAALQFLRGQAGWHAINLGTGQGQSVLELLKAFERACGKSLPWEAAPRRAGDLPSYYANSAKAAAVLGWRAHRSLDEMCSSTWNWQSGRVAAAGKAAVAGAAAAVGEAPAAGKATGSAAGAAAE